jgi:hypothetical protein
MSLHLSPTRTTLPVSRSFRRTTARFAAMALVLVAGAACSDDDPDPVAPEPATLSLSETSVTLVRTTGAAAPTKQINVEVTGTTNANVTWTAFRPAIATITPGGLITGLSEGTTFFTATSEADPTLNRTVVVNVVSTIVTTTPAASFSWVGGPTRTIAATVTNNANTGVTWTSSAPAVATVSATGVVTPLTAGTTTLTATSAGDAGKSATTAFTVDAAPGAEVVLTSGTAVSGLAGATGSATYYRIAVPVGATSLAVTTTGGTGDLDLYVRAGLRPTFTTFTCASGGSSSAETCTIANPQPRIYYIMLDGYAAYTGVTLTATVTTP